GCAASVRCEVRARWLAGGAQGQWCEVRLEPCRARQCRKARGQPRTASPHVLAALRALKRLEGAGQTLRHAVTVLAVVAPDWLPQSSPPDGLPQSSPPDGLDR